MSTAIMQIKSSEGWTKVAEAAQAFFVENRSATRRCFLFFSSSEPVALADGGHTIEPGNAAIRPPGITDPAWISTNAAGPITVIVSTS